MKYSIRLYTSEVFVFQVSIAFMHANSDAHTSKSLVLVQNSLNFDLGTFNNQSLKLIQTLQNALKTHSNES